MKLVLINAVYGFGSTGLIIKDIDETVEANRSEVRIVYQYANQTPKSGFRIGNKLDWKIHALYTRLTGKQAFASKTATRRLICYLRREKPDVVHLHNLHANYINLPLLLEYLAREGIATVITLHDCWFFTGKCTHFAAVNCGAWRSGCGNCPKRFESPASVIRDSSASVLAEKTALYGKLKNLTVVGCSKWIANLAEQSIAFQGCRIMQIYNGVDTSIFAPMDRARCRARHDISAGLVILGMANKWLDEKNQIALHETISFLSEEDQLLLVGCSEEQQRLVSGLGKVRAISFIKSREELAEYYNAADVFCNLTFEDTLPTVNMEAASCGTPVVTYDSCGSPELVQDGTTGFVVKQGDIAGLKLAFTKIKNQEICRETCRSFALTSFGKKERYQEYLDLYKSVIQ